MSWRDRIAVWATPAGVVLGLAALVAWSCWQRWQMLAASPFPIGVDGYFYPIQLRSLLEHGHLQYAASPLTFWFMAPFAAATDPITGAKLGAAIGGALVAIPAYGVGARLAKHRTAGLVAASFAVLSTGSTFLTMEFVKNGLGLTVALAALWLVLRAIERPSRGRLVAMAAAVLAALLTHKMAAGMVIAIGAPAAVAEAIAIGALRGRRLIYLIVAAATAVLGLLVLGLVAPRRFVSPDDLALVGHLFTSTASWRAPALATRGVTLEMGHEALYGLAFAALAAIAMIAAQLSPTGPTGPTGPTRPTRPTTGRAAAPRHTAGERTAVWIVIGLALVIGLPWLAVDDPQGLGFRLRLAAFVPAALCAAIALGTASRWVGELASTYVPIAVALVILQHAPTRTTELEGEIITHPALASAVMALGDQISADDTVIVPERHIAYMVAWYTGAKVSIQPDPVPREHRQRLLPLAFTGADSPLDHALMDARHAPGVIPPLGLHPRHPNGLVLVAEPTWEWLLAKLPPKASHYFGAWPTI